MESYINIVYLISSICFIYGLKMLSHPKTARNGNMIASLGMLLAILATIVNLENQMDNAHKNALEEEEKSSEEEALAEETNE